MAIKKKSSAALSRTLDEKQLLQNIVYIGVQIDDSIQMGLRESVKNLNTIIGTKYEKAYCDHITLAYGASNCRKFLELIGHDVSFDMNDTMIVNKALACVAVSNIRDEIDGWSISPDNEFPHVTLACAKGVAPVQSNEVIKTLVNESKGAMFVNRFLTNNGWTKGYGYVYAFLKDKSYVYNCGMTYERSQS